MWIRYHKYPKDKHTQHCSMYRAMYMLWLYRCHSCMLPTKNAILCLYYKPSRIYRNCSYLFGCSRTIPKYNNTHSHNHYRCRPLVHRAMYMRLLCKHRRHTKPRMNAILYLYCKHCRSFRSCLNRFAYSHRSIRYHRFPKDKHMHHCSRYRAMYRPWLYNCHLYTIRMRNAKPCLYYKPYHSCRNYSYPSGYSDTNRKNNNSHSHRHYRCRCSVHKAMYMQLLYSCHLYM